MTWTQEHRIGAGSTSQIEDAHKALDTIEIKPGPLSIRVLETVGMVARLQARIQELEEDNEWSGWGADEI